MPTKLWKFKTSYSARLSAVKCLWDGIRTLIGAKGRLIPIYKLDTQSKCLVIMMGGALACVDLDRLLTTLSGQT